MVFGSGGVGGSMGRSGRGGEGGPDTDGDRWVHHCELEGGGLQTDVERDLGIVV
jgi:hypothetical protein